MAPLRRTRFLPSPGIDESFRPLGYVAHLVRSSLGGTREPIRSPRISPAPGEIGITWIGHSTVLIELDGVAILTDPILSKRLLLLPRLVAPGIPVEGLPPLDLVLVSHAHHDHCDLPTHRRLETGGATALVARNLGGLLRPMGYRRVVEMDWEDVHRVGDVTVRAVEVNHWGTRNLLPDGRGYSGFVIEGPSGTVFFPGDTAATPLFEDYGRRFDVDVALLPIGAYKPASFRRVHMNPEDAFGAFEALGARTLVPIHWGTFVLSYEPVDEPPRWIERLCREAGRADDLALLQPGEARLINRS